MTNDRQSLRPSRLAAIRRYLVAVAAGNLIWETAQLPLYTLWRTDAARSITSAVLHCTAGDFMIATVALVVALATVGDARWPRERWVAVAVAVVVIGVSYTIWSEYQNTAVRKTWTYTEYMPVLPWIGTGLAPLAQWIMVPLAALIVVRHQSKINRTEDTP